MQTGRKCWSLYHISVPKHVRLWNVLYVWLFQFNNLNLFCRVRDVSYPIAWISKSYNPFHLWSFPSVIYKLLTKRNSELLVVCLKPQEVNTKTIFVKTPELFHEGTRGKDQVVNFHWLETMKAAVCMMPWNYPTFYPAWKQEEFTLAQKSQQSQYALS